MKKLWIALLTMLLIVVSVGTALSASSKPPSTNFVKVYTKDNVTVEVDLKNIIFHKLDDKIALEFVSRLTDERTNKIVISKMYVIPDVNKFRILEYAIIDSKKGIVTDSSTKVGDWKPYTDDSIVAQCVNYIINNKKSE